MSTYSAPLLTLGIDLASASDKTAFALVEWTRPTSNSRHPRDYKGQLVQLCLQGSDHDLLQFHPSEQCLIGLDAPLGWPASFVQYISTPLKDLKSFARPAQVWGPEFRDQFRYRQTDYYTRSVLGRWPLSVSTDYLSLVGLRARGLLRLWDISNITGEDFVYEVYPAVALKRWGLVHRGYKGSTENKVKIRQEMLIQLSHLFSIHIPTHFKIQLVQSDHGFDAFICALITLYASLDLCDLPSDDSIQQLSQHEGWIYIPHSPPLSSLKSSLP